MCNLGKGRTLDFPKKFSKYEQKLHADSNKWSGSQAILWPSILKGALKDTNPDVVRYLKCKWA